MAKRSVSDRLKGLYHDVRGSVDADYTPPAQKVSPAAAKKKTPVKKKGTRNPFSLSGVVKTVRDRKKEIDLKKILR